MDNNSVLANKLVGKIPEDWSYINFKDVYGKPIRDFGSFSTTKLITFLSDGVPFLKSEMINEGSIDWTNTYYISEEVHKLLNKSYVEKDTILFSKIGSALGKAVVYTGEKGVCNSNAAIAKIILNEQIADKYYYTYILNNSLAKKQFLRLIVSLLPRINLGDISDLVLPLPPLPEQQKIAKILSTWDKAISITERLIDNSTQQKKALMQQLLTGKKRLLDDEGKRFEGEWEKEILKNLGKTFIGLVTTMTKSYVDEGIPLIRNSDIKPNHITKERMLSLCEEFATKHENRKLREGDVVTVHTGEVGVSAVIDRELDGCIGFATLNTRPDTERLNPHFLSWYFNSEYFINWCVSMSTGDGRQNLNLKDFVKAEVPLPSLDEQKKIVSVLTNAVKEIELLEQQLADLEQEKKALMQVLLTGKKRVVINDRT